LLRVYHFVGLGFLVGISVVAAFAFGRITTPTPKPPVPVPTNEQLTIAASTLVHGLEVQNDYSLMAAPDFVGCHPVKSSLACDFGVTYIDESTAVWELVLDKKNIPTIIKRIKSAPAPPAG